MTAKAKTKSNQDHFEACYLEFKMSFRINNITLTHLSTRLSLNSTRKTLMMTSCRHKKDFNGGRQIILKSLKVN